MLNGQGGAAAPWWRELTRRSPLGAVLVTSFVATQAAVLVGYLLPVIGLPAVAWPELNGELVASYDHGSTAEAFLAGWLVAATAGSVATFLYAVFVSPIVARTVGHLVSGVAFGLALGIVAAGLVLPFVHAPDSGYGAFMAGGEHGWKLPIAVVVSLVAYGLLLGLLLPPERAEGT